MTSVILALALLAIAGGFYFFKKRIDKALSSEQWVSSIRDEIDQLVLEMNQTAERNVALLENRIKTLESLLGEADRKLMLLQKEQEKSDLSRQVYSHLKKNTLVSTPESSQDKSTLQLTLEDEELSHEKDEKKKSLKDRVMELYSQGFSADIISQKLQASIAEVDLIISLQTEGGER